MTRTLEFRTETLEFAAGVSVVASGAGAGVGGMVDLGADASVTDRIVIGQPTNPKDLLQELDRLRRGTDVINDSISATGNTFSNTLPVSKLAAAQAEPPLPPRLGGTGLSAGPQVEGGLAFVSADGSRLEFDPRLTHRAHDDQIVVEGAVVAGGIRINASNNYLGLPTVFAAGVSLLDPSTSTRPAIALSAVAAPPGRVAVSVTAEVATANFVTLDKVSVTELEDANAFPGRVLNGFASVHHASSNAASTTGTFQFEIDAPGSGNKVYAVVSDSAGNTSEVREVP